MPYLVGLTGGIGSGKSRVSQHFAKLGIDSIDSDQIARELVAPGQPALAEIMQAFGPQIIGQDGRLNRASLRKLVFDDIIARNRLENILHPRIRSTLLERSQHASSPYVLLVIPLLVENNWQTLVNRVVVVDCAPATQVRRVMQRDNIDENAVRAILAAQASRSQRLLKADDVIHNDADDANLAAQIAALHRTLLQQVEKHRPRGKTGLPGRKT
ncbi:dephospho-CoA kinase [Acidihalobacter ferrooxydans]|uniref:Dephospho-CoA kinase n=1 Tax=Acidihalobacter ferrooxydans TaxID=1765967 RepID=A0A1P8UIQ6_9GAMM|nr:dephospho-CoA kinase [Acidihalobacter ferrooxydans]APZ43718.1 dephospho-CoA kinase [Acidihalobacter ferrooxydans]